VWANGRGNDLVRELVRHWIQAFTNRSGGVDAELSDQNWANSFSAFSGSSASSRPGKPNRAQIAPLGVVEDRPRVCRDRLVAVDLHCCLHEREAHGLRVALPRAHQSPARIRLEHHPQVRDGFGFSNPNRNAGRRRWRSLVDSGGITLHSPQIKKCGRALFPVKRRLVSRQGAFGASPFVQYRQMVRLSCCIVACSSK
jgi:hypothetical protein